MCVSQLDYSAGPGGDFARPPGTPDDGTYWLIPDSLKRWNKIVKRMGKDNLEEVEKEVRPCRTASKRRARI